MKAEEFVISWTRASDLESVVRGTGWTKGKVIRHAKWLRRQGVKLKKLGSLGELGSSRN